MGRPIIDSMIRDDRLEVEITESVSWNISPRYLVVVRNIDTQEVIERHMDDDYANAMSAYWRFTEAEFLTEEQRAAAQAELDEGLARTKAHSLYGRF